MKFGISLILLLLSGVIQASDYNNYYQGAYYPANYYAQSGYPAPGYPVQNHYAPYVANSYQVPRYQVPQYRYPAYAYPNYYQPPYQEHYYPHREYTGRMPDNTLQRPESSSKESKKPDSKTALKDNPGSEQSIEKLPLAKDIQNTSLSRLTATKLLQSTRKQQFLNRILPLILSENKIIHKDRKKLLRILDDLNNNKPLTPETTLWIKKLAKEYRVSGNILDNSRLQQELLKRVDSIVPAMALAQAANESAWGTSRFSKEGNNLFGIWTYNPEIGIKPLKREPGKKHFVRKFSSFQESVAIYMRTLNTHTAYKKLREIRYEAALQGRRITGYELAKGLEKYSAKGRAYIKMIQVMINNNNLEQIALAEMALN